MLSLENPLAALLALSAAFGASTGFAADGDLDPSFGTGGIAYITPDLVDAQELQPYKAIVLPDGKILFGGSLDAPTTRAVRAGPTAACSRASTPTAPSTPASATARSRASSRCRSSSPDHRMEEHRVVRAARRRLDRRGRHFAGELAARRASSSRWTRTAPSTRRSRGGARLRADSALLRARGRHRQPGPHRRRRRDDRHDVRLHGRTSCASPPTARRMRRSATTASPRSHGTAPAIGLSRRSDRRTPTTASSSPASTRSTAAASAATSRSRSSMRAGAPTRRSATAARACSTIRPTIR